MRSLALLPFLVLAGPSLAQTNLSGDISDDTTGPLLGGQVYHLVGTVTVPPGKTLTVQPGAIVKGAAQTHFIVQGDLLALGTALSPIVLTALPDDTAGGDTNADGPSSGSPGYWRGLYLQPSATGSVLEHLDVRFAGQGGFSGIDLFATGLTLDGCSVSDCATEAVDLHSVEATFLGCAFTDNGGIAVDNMPLQSVAGCSGNTASGNGGDYMRTTTFAHTADLTIGPGNPLGGVLFLDFSPQVASGFRLTLEAGLVVKVRAQGHVIAQGQLEVAGTAQDPVVFTSILDDDYGGDTNDDGPSQGAPGDWRGLYFHPSAGASSLAHAEVRYAGQATFAGIDLFAGIPVSDCLVRQCAAEALDLHATAATATVTGCSFVDNGGLAVDNLLLQTVPNFSGNSATGNVAGDVMRVVSFNHTQDLSIAPGNCLGGVLFLDFSPSVATGLRLTLEAGLVVKLRLQGHLVVQGQLDVPGTAQEPVVFTSIFDDEVGGDTNADGASQGAPGDWRGLYFHPSAGASSLSHAEVRFAGQAGYSVFDLFAPITVGDCLVRQCAADALDLHSTSVGATVSGCTFQDNGGYAADGVLLEALPGFSGNTAAGNLDNYTRVPSATPSTDVSVGLDNVIGDVILCADSLNVPAGRTVTLQPGLVVKFLPQRHVILQGDLVTAGTPDAPVIFTSLYDDSVAGDTDGGGQAAAPGDWRGVYLHPSSSAVLEQLVVRYAGQAGFAGVESFSPTATLKGVRVAHCAASGFELHDAGVEPSHVTAWDCAWRGFDLIGGATILRRATSYANGQEGILHGAGFTGSVTDSISVGNGLDNFAGFAAGEVRFSNGSALFAGSDGNIDADPRFVDPTNGVLGLREGSPCIDTGDPLSPLDPDLSRADMGAHYYDYCFARPYCKGKTSSAGCTPSITFSGYPDATGPDDFHVIANDVLGQAPGVLLWGLQPNPPFAGAVAPSERGVRLCVSGPSVLTAVVASGTAGQCDGQFDHHLTDADMANLGFVAGTTLYVQFVYQDPAHPDGTGMGYTDALRFRICP